MADDDRAEYEQPTEIATALERFRLASAADTDQRARELDDLTFEFDPWPQAAKDARGGYKAYGEVVPPRPMLSIPMLDQPLQLTINQEKAAHLGIEIHPDPETADDANDETAEIQQGLIRQIEVRSRAHLARSWAFERAVKCGRGYYRILKRYCRAHGTGPAAYDQELVVARILNQASVYLDPSHCEPDGSDAKYAFITQDLDPDEYARLYGDSTLAKWSSGDFEALGDAAAPWLSENHRRIAEYFTVDVKKRNLVAYKGKGGRRREGYEDALPKGFVTGLGANLLNMRPVESRVVRWRLINAAEVLDEIEWDGHWIPIVQVIGKEANINGERRYTGIIGPAKDSVRLVNYAATAITEKVALDTKTPWILAEGQEEGHEAEIVRATVRPVPFVRYKPTSIAGTPTPPPQRNVLGPNLTADIELLQQAKDFVHSATSVFEPSLGRQTPNVRTKGATLALQQQAEQANSGFLDNFANISVAHEARILLDLLAPVYDRPGRIARIIDKHEEPQQVMLNQPYVEHPETGAPMPVKPGQPVPAGPNGQPLEVKHYDLRKGAYTSVVSIGKSYQTKMQQGSDALAALLQADPALMPIIGWRYFEYNDSIPGHHEIAEDLKKIRPPQLQDDQQQPDPQQLQQQIAQMGQMMDLLTKELNAKNQVIETDAVKQQGQAEIKKIESDAKVAIAQLDRDAKIVVAALQAKVADGKVLLEAAASAAELLTQHDHEAREAEKDRAHEAGMAAAGVGADADQSAQDHAEALTEGDQAHQQALAQGAQGIDGQLAVQAAKPQPTNGAGA